MATTKVPEVRDIMRIERIGENVFYLPTAYMYYEVLTAKNTQRCTFIWTMIKIIFFALF